MLLQNYYITFNEKLDISVLDDGIYFTSALIASFVGLRLCHESYDRFRCSYYQ